MDFKIMKCPVCGAPLDAGLNEKFIICRACDTPLRLNEDATSFLKDPEAFGYGFEKGRQRAQAEEELRRSGQRGSYYTGERSYRQDPPGRYQDQGYYDQPGYNQPYSGRANYSGYAGMDPEVSDKDKWTAFVLCLVLGLFGGHQFYVGRVGKGLLYVFTVGLFSFGWLFDLILILMGSFKDANGRVLVSSSERYNRGSGNPYGGEQPYGGQQRSYGGAQQPYSNPQRSYSGPQQPYGGQPGSAPRSYSQPGYSEQGYGQPGYDADVEWARKMKTRRKIFLGLTILFGVALLGNLMGGESSGVGMMAICTGIFGYLYYKTPRP